MKDLALTQSILLSIMNIPFFKHRRSRTYGTIKETADRDEMGESFLRAHWPVIWRAVLALGALGFVFGSIMVIWISKDLPDPNKLNERKVAESTQIFDRTGEHLLYEIYQSQKRTIVGFDAMSPWIPKATIAVEDKYFYEHSGIRVVSIIRAAVNNLLGRSAGSGGASTLTQQLIKNTIVGDQHSIFRKIKEAILALRLEKKYSKEDILKMYLNEMPYGSTNYGVEAASQSYFRKASKDLDISESATLAALLKAPSRYLNNANLLRDRRDLVIRLMFDQGMITEEQKIAAQGSALRIYTNSGIMNAPHFVLYVKQMLADKYGENTVDTAGLKVITTLDYDKQLEAEKIVKEQGDKFAKSADANNAALVAVDPKTGQILAMVGSRDFNNEEIDGQFNVAVLGLRQPGSSFKPFVYTAAFEKGYTPETVIYDTITNFDLSGAKAYEPHNYDGKEHGLVTIRKALQGSLNIPAVKTMYLVGEKETIEFASRFGYTSFTGDYGLSLVLGGGEVNLLEHTMAYATLANNGTYLPSVSILEIQNPDGSKAFEWKQDAGREAVKPEIAATIAGVLSDDKSRQYIFGANSTLTLGDRPVAAKTGTTNDYKDAWTMGYTPSLTVGVWVGNTTPKPMKGGGNTLAGTIWNQFMRFSLKDTPAETFPTPPTNTATKPVLRGADGGIRLPINSSNGKIAVSTTPPNLIVERTYLLPHDILHYVDREDPTGPAPLNPLDDPQYDNWEGGLRAWIDKSNGEGANLILEEPPTVLDDGSNAEFAPVVTITSLSQGSNVTDENITLSCDATSPRGVTNVVFYVDGKLVATVNNPPFTTNFNTGRLTKGNHILKVVASDDQSNTGLASLTFSFNGAMGAPDIDWSEEGPLTLEKTDYPKEMRLTPFRYDTMKIVKIFLKGPTGPIKYIYNFSPVTDKLAGDQLSFTWNNYPGAGTYILQAEMTDTENRTVIKELEVMVK